MTDPDWPRLAEVIRTRRLELGLSARSASDAAGINRATWAAAESTRHRLGERLWAPVERALAWGPGSVAAILDGGQPTLAKVETPTETRVDVRAVADILCATLPGPAMDTLLAELLTRRASS